jgi:hypothetical protein
LTARVVHDSSLSEAAHAFRSSFVTLAPLPDQPPALRRDLPCHSTDELRSPPSPAAPPRAATPRRRPPGATHTPNADTGTEDTRPTADAAERRLTDELPSGRAPPWRRG